MDPINLRVQITRFKKYALLPSFVISAALLVVLGIAGLGVNDVYTGSLLNSKRTACVEMCEFLPRSMLALGCASREFTVIPAFKFQA